MLDWKNTCALKATMIGYILHNPVKAMHASPVDQAIQLYIYG